MQDLRKFCIASQARDSEKDSPAYKELQQQQQQMMSQLSNVESLANQANASTVHISTRLDKVMQCCNAHQAPVNSQSSSCIKASWKLLSSHLRCHSHKRKRSSGYGYVVVSCTSTRGDGFRCCASLFVCRCDVIVRLLMMQTGVLYVQGSQCFFYCCVHFLHLSLVHLHVCPL